MFAPGRVSAALLLSIVCVYRLGYVDAFASPPSLDLRSTLRFVNTCSRITMQAAPENEGMMNSRRGFLSLALAGAASFTLSGESKPASAAPSTFTVIGGNGRTGRYCVESLLADGQDVRRVCHKPVEADKDIFASSKGLSTVVASVTELEALDSAIKGSAAVIVTVGSKIVSGYKSETEDFDDPTNTPEKVDQQGVINVALMCIKHKVPRLVVLSSACTRCSQDGNSGGDKTCRTCDCKHASESAIREMYAAASDPSISYTVVKAGQLFDADKRGPTAIELNQGGDKSGLISRGDMADLLVASAKSPSAGSTTFEAYYTMSAQPRDMRKSLQMCDQQGISKQQCFFGDAFKTTERTAGKKLTLDDVMSAPIQGTIFPSGRETHSDGKWETLFVGLSKDSEESIDLMEFGAASG